MKTAKIETEQQPIAIIKLRVTHTWDNPVYAGSGCSIGSIVDDMITDATREGSDAELHDLKIYFSFPQSVKVEV